MALSDKSLADKTIDYDLMNIWFNEVERWPNGDGVTGHFREVAWAKSSRIGCGLVVYYTPNADGSRPNWGKLLLNCRYASDETGGSIFEAGPTASNCPAGYSANDGLCRNNSPAQPMDAPPPLPEWTFPQN